MRKFISLCVTCFGLSLFILAGMNTLRRVQPASNQLQQAGFDLCNGVPCFMDIVPQETSMQETIQRLLPYLKPTILVSNDPSEGVFEVDLATGRFGMLDGDYPAPDYLDFKQFKTGFPKLGEFVLFYGEPCYVRVWEFARGVTRTSLFYPGLVITVVGPSTNDLDPQQTIDGLSLIRVANICYDASNRVEHSDWHGFVAVQSYR